MVSTDYDTRYEEIEVFLKATPEGEEMLKEFEELWLKKTKTKYLEGVLCSIYHSDKVELDKAFKFSEKLAERIMAISEIKDTEKLLLEIM